MIASSEGARQAELHGEPELICSKKSYLTQIAIVFHHLQRWLLEFPGIFPNIFLDRAVLDPDVRLGTVGADDYGQWGVLQEFRAVLLCLGELDEQFRISVCIVVRS